MIRFEARQDGSGRWRLVSRTRAGADVLAHEAGTPDLLPWRQAVEWLRRGGGEVEVVGTPVEHFHWVLHAADGTVVAESPAVHRDPAVCRIAFTNAERAARTVFGGLREPQASGGRLTRHPARLS
ncbi:hypothetical protein [Pseudosporangium ferrugineum]|uniref:DUF1508 domain-containing protein n=1 Tax=Pseudosporangium ferrugineum TaxID=439699 RepID=A0A2T0RG57_9ACTN|nr:hypothetical protein [Pseudosporangium ferrugineum]PRY20145.1 hypothetical protein CLV70_12526 [Pseudosporangium ferrugineum]